MDVPPLSNVSWTNVYGSDHRPLSLWIWRRHKKPTRCSAQLMKFPFRESETNSREILGKRRTGKQRDKRPSTNIHQRCGSPDSTRCSGTTLSEHYVHDALRMLHPISDYYQKYKSTVCKWRIQTVNSKNWLNSLVKKILYSTPKINSFTRCAV